MKTQIDDELIFVIKHGIKDLSDNINDLNTCVCNSMAMADTKIETQFIEIDKSLLSISLNVCQKLDSLLDNQVENQVAIANILDSISANIETNTEVLDLGFDRLNNNLEKLISVLERNSNTVHV